MGKDILIQYCGPYTIQTSDAAMSSQFVDSVSVAIERNELREHECPVAQEVNKFK